MKQGPDIENMKGVGGGDLDLALMTGWGELGCVEMSSWVSNTQEHIEEVKEWPAGAANNMCVCLNCELWKVLEVCA